MATVKFHVWENKMVHVIYSDVLDAPLTAGITAEEIMAAMQEESGVEVPEMAELRTLNTSCKLVHTEATDESESDAGEKYVVRAVLRYVPVADESESL